MTDFETMPIGTKERIKELERKLEACKRAMNIETGGLLEIIQHEKLEYKHKTALEMIFEESAKIINSSCKQYLKEIGE
jgi:hypothetical protein